MATEEAERRAVVRAQQMGAPLPPMEHQDPLPCPRCTSTNTKFCYYNNYNFSQPRHFCKSCRRYWTHGGTLRDIPVGGGTRKTAKRSRTSSSSSSHSSVPSSVTATSTSSVGPILEPIPLNQAQPQAHHPVYVSGATPVGGGFTSLLSGGGICNNGGLLALGGYGLGIGLEEYGLGIGRGVWAFPNHEVGSSYVENTNNSGGDVNAGSNNNSSGSNDGVGVGGGSGGVSRNDTWQVESGEVVGFVGAAGYFASLPELAMSSSPNLLK